MSHDLSAALADPDPQAALGALEALVQATVGARLYTVMALDPDTGMARQVWTSDPDTYPVGGEKPLPDNFFDLYPGVPYSIPWRGAKPPKVLKVGNLAQRR